MASRLSNLVLECSLCGYFSPSLSQHVSHLRLVHSQDPNFVVNCSIRGCSSQFITFAAFNTHMYRHHREALGLQRGVSESLDTSSSVGEFSNEKEVQDHEQGVAVELDDSVTDSVDHGCNNPLEVSCLSENCQESNAKFLLRLGEDHRLSEVAIQDVISGCREVSMHTATHVKEVVKSKLLELHIDSSLIDQVDQEVDDSLLDPFDGLGFTYLRNKYFKEHFHYVEPQEITLGKPYYVERYAGKKRQKVLRSSKFYYVPLLETLKLLLTNKEIQNELASPHHSAANFEDFCDGSIYKDHPLFSVDPSALHVIGYYNELEVANPLGSYVKKTNLGAFFFLWEIYDHSFALLLNLFNML